MLRAKRHKLIIIISLDKYGNDTTNDNKYNNDHDNDDDDKSNNINDDNDNNNMNDNSNDTNDNNIDDNSNHQVNGMRANPAHPVHKFGTGSKATTP